MASIRGIAIGVILGLALGLNAKERPIHITMPDDSGHYVGNTERKPLVARIKNTEEDYQGHDLP